MNEPLPTIQRLFDDAERLRRAGRAREAEARYRELLTHRPRHRAALYRLGILVFQQGRVAEAVDWLDQARTVDPDNAQLHCDLGVMRRRLGQPELALAHYQASLRLDPSQSRVYNNLGNLLKQLGRSPEAAQNYRLAVEKDPAYAAGWMNLAEALRVQGELDAARAAAEQALERAPGDAAILNTLGAVLSDLGELDQGLACFQRATQAAPRFALAWCNYGTILQRKGRIDEAVSAYRRALELDPTDTKALRYLSRNIKFRPGDSELRNMEHLLQQPRVSKDDRIDLHFALGKAYDDAGDYAKAFDHIAAANRLQRQHVRYSASANTAQVDRLIKTFSPEFFRHHALAGSDSEVPLFVLGMPRSGTSLVEQILASHPAVFGAGELTLLLRLPDRLSALLQQPYPRCVDGLDQSLCARLAAEYLAILRKPAPHALRVIDKTPFYFTVLGLIQLLFPRARVIHCQRDALDTGLSCFANRFTDSVPFVYDLAEIGAYYRDYRRLMAHWRATLSLSMLEIRYEDLVANLESVSRRMIEFCGLEWSDRCLAYHQTERVVQTASSWQVRQPIYASSVQRWRHYEPWLGPMIQALAAEG